MRKKTHPVVLRKLSVFVTPSQDAAILQESKIKRHITKQAWLAEAVREYLKKSGFAPEEDIGLLAGLSLADQRRVERYIELLRAAADDETLRVAVDANFDLFERSLRR